MKTIALIVLVSIAILSCQKEDPISTTGTGSNSIPVANTANSVVFTFKGKTYHYKSGVNGLLHQQWDYYSENDPDSADLVVGWELYRPDTEGFVFGFGFTDIVHKATWDNNKLAVYPQIFSVGEHTFGGEFISENSGIYLSFQDENQTLWSFNVDPISNKFEITQSAPIKDIDGNISGQLVKGNFKIHIVDGNGVKDSLCNGSFMLLVN